MNKNELCSFIYKLYHLSFKSMYFNIYTLNLLCIDISDNGLRKCGRAPRRQVLIALLWLEPAIASGCAFINLGIIDNYL
jgi:hypothetical protein